MTGHGPTAAEVLGYRSLLQQSKGFAAWQAIA